MSGTRHRLDVNGVTVTGEVIENVAKQYLAATGKPLLEGLVFDPRAPQGGKTGKQLWIPYGGANMVIWKYDAGSDGYQRYQDQYDGRDLCAGGRSTDQPADCV